MADSKITALTAISTVDPTADPLVIVDVSDTSMAASGTTKKSTINQLLGAGGTATLASATITGAATVGTTLGVTGAATVGTTLLVGTNATLTNGNVILGTSGKGIDFSATANGSGTMTSELLSDYEEGTFTPVLTTDAVNFTSVAYIIQQARYTKIGRLVTISGTIYTSSVVKGSASGNVVITGLPFAQPAGDVLGGGNCNVSEVWLADNPIEFVVSGSSVVLLKRATSTGASANLVVADVGTGTSNFVRFIGQYYV